MRYKPDEQSKRVSDAVDASLIMVERSSVDPMAFIS
jgi:hypothetical protein